ncbi:hypothetical protein UlMin_008769 [Ulmus minor]
MIKLDIVLLQIETVITLPTTIAIYGAKILIAFFNFVENVVMLLNNVIRPRKSCCGKILLLPMMPLLEVLMIHLQSWLVDSGVSHQVTMDLSNLSLHEPYEGPDNIVIGDGTDLHRIEFTNYEWNY